MKQMMKKSETVNNNVEIVVITCYLLEYIKIEQEESALLL
jgi:hypothetical protein